MGKAGILVWPAVVIVIGLIIYGIARLASKTPQEPKSVRKKAELADEAYDVMIDLMHPRNLNEIDVTILSKEDKTKIQSWYAKYRKVSS